MSTPAARPTCRARVGETMPQWAPRRDALCGATAVDLVIVARGTRSIELPICGLHRAALCRAADPAVLTRRWLP